MKKTVSRLALVAGASLLATSAIAADLGGNCCADLEERVAELEATTARKGNRVMSLTIYGQVARSIIWHNDDVAGSDADVTFRDNDGRSGTRFGFRGSAKVSSDITIGYHLEAAFDTEEGNTANILNQRLSYVYIGSERLGNVALGQKGTATDGIVEIALASIITPFGAEEGADVSVVAANVTPSVDGGRERGIHYVSPILQGFTLSASYFHVDDVPNNNAGDINNGWDVALRYAGEFNGVRIAAGVGYREEEATGVVIGDSENEFFGMSASVMHVATGLYLNAGWQQREGDTVNDIEGWNIQGGVARKFNALGTTTFGANYGSNEGINANTFEGTYYGLGIVQEIDAAATDLYLTWQSYEDNAGVGGADRDADVIQAGMRVRF